jgi:hypothetical protein
LNEVVTGIFLTSRRCFHRKVSASLSLVRISCALMTEPALRNQSNTYGIHARVGGTPYSVNGRLQSFSILSARRLLVAAVL